MTEAATKLGMLDGLPEDHITDSSNGFVDFERLYWSEWSDEALHWEPWDSKEESSSRNKKRRYSLPTSPQTCRERYYSQLESCGAREELENILDEQYTPIKSARKGFKLVNFKGYSVATPSKRTGDAALGAGKETLATAMEAHEDSSIFSEADIEKIAKEIVRGKVESGKSDHQLVMTEKALSVARANVHKLETKLNLTSSDLEQARGEIEAFKKDLSSTQEELTECHSKLVKVEQDALDHKQMMNCKKRKVEIDALPSEKKPRLELSAPLKVPGAFPNDHKINLKPETSAECSDSGSAVVTSLHKGPSRVGTKKDGKGFMKFLKRLL